MPTTRWGRGRGKGRAKGLPRSEKKAIKKEVRKDVRKAFGPSRRGLGRGRGPKGPPRSSVPRSRVISVPGARSSQYRGSQMVFMSSTKRSSHGQKFNCTRMATRANLGKLQVYPVTGVGTIAFKCNGTADVGGQWFFSPTMSIYWPQGSQTFNMALMYQYFYLNNVWFEFESSYQPGNTVNYDIAYCIVENANIGESSIAGYTSVTPLTVQNVLQNNISGVWPAFKAKHVIKIPPKYYRGIRYVTRSYSLVGPVSTGSSTTVAQNIQNIPFGIWFSVDGPNPTGTIDLCRVFIHYDIELCELAATQIYNNTGGSTFSDPALEMKDLKSQFADVKLEISDMRRKLVLAGDDDFIVSDSPKRRDSLKSVELRSDFDRLSLKMKKEDLKERKSASNK
jgi:hypothetical protein